MHKIIGNRGTWVAQSVKWLTSAQVMISQFGSSSPTPGSLLSAQSLLWIISPPLSLLLPCANSLSKINIYLKKNWQYLNIGNFINYIQLVGGVQFLFSIPDFLSTCSIDSRKMCEVSNYNYGFVCCSFHQLLPWVC